MSLPDKLASFDEHANAAVDDLLAWIIRDRDALIAAARGRLVEGHYRYGDKLMYEYGTDELKAEASQEVADAINYLHLRVARLRSEDRGVTDGNPEPGKHPVIT